MGTTCCVAPERRTLHPLHVRLFAPPVLLSSQCQRRRRGNSPPSAPSAPAPPPPTSTTGPWPATPAGLSSGAASGSLTVVWRGRETAILTGPADAHASGAGLTSQYQPVLN